MRKLLFGFGLLALLSIPTVGWGKGEADLDVSMTADGPTVSGKKLGRSEEKTERGFLVRTKLLKSGGQSLLLKAVGNTSVASVFGRRVNFRPGGQYQVKWDGETGGIDTAFSESDGEKWVAPPDIYKWFSGQDAKETGNIRIPRKIVFDKGEATLPPVRPRAPGDIEDIPPLADPEGEYLPPLAGPPRNGADSEVVPISQVGGDSEGEYVVQPGDTIDLHFYRVQRVTVDMRGDIRVVSSVGNAESAIKVAGRTTKEIADAVGSSGLNFRSITDPALKVNVSRFSDRSIVVLGNVNRPGKIPLEDGEILGVLGALKKAGGVAGNSSRAVVYVKRGDRITKADLGESDETALDTFRILPGDIITVNRKNEN